MEIKNNIIFIFISQRSHHKNLKLILITFQISNYFDNLQESKLASM